MGSQFVLPVKGNQSILANKPKRRRKIRVPSDEQKEVRLKFKAAVTYAQTVLNDPPLKLDYLAAARPGQSAFNVAFSDAYLGPEISNLDTSAYKGIAGNQFRVRVQDNFYVKQVMFYILEPDGSEIESGVATLESNGLDYFYIAKVNNPELQGTIIRVTAEDLPMNRTVLDKTL